MTFLELAEEILRMENRPLTATEIWSAATVRGLDSQLNSQGKTPWSTLAAQIYVNTRDNPRSPFGQTETRPKKFFLKSMAASMDVTLMAESLPKPSNLKKKPAYLEKDLHAVLSYYAYYHLNCYTKTIHHLQSTKKEFGEWVHPDIVGCYFPLDDWKQEVFELSFAIGNISIRLFSFELKRELGFGNLRESFFQTVSNSSWANESYLVAAEISKEEDFLDELSRLSTSFGIGVIQLNLEDPHSSEIILPAKRRDQLDWETINKLTMNPDFKEFLSTVRIDLSSKKIHRKEYDPVPDLEELKSRFASL